MKKKIKSIALVLAGAVCLVGAGYAAWGNSVTANTALNSGQWSVVLENDVPNHSLAARDEVSYYNKDGSLSTIKEGDFVPAGDYNQAGKYATTIPSTTLGDDHVYTIEPTITNENKTATFAFYNLHPGTKAITDYEIRNNGSIPAKIGNVIVTVTDKNGVAIDPTSKLYNAIEVSGNIAKHLGSAAPTEPALTFSGVKLADLASTLQGLLVDDSYVLDHRKSVSVLDSDEIEVNAFTFAIPMTSLNGTEGTDEGLNVSVQYDFVQYNQLVE